MESAEIWNDITDELNVNAICPDLLGHGNNRIDTFSSVSQMTDAILKVLDDLNAPEYNVVGHSMGGYVALDLFEKDARCQKVMLLNSNFWEDSAEKKQDRLRVVDAVRHNKNRFIKEVIPNLFADPNDFEEVIQGLVEKAKGMSAEAIGNASLAMRARHDKTELVRSHSHDIVVVQGASDTVMPIEIMRSMLPEDVVMEVLKSGHMSWCEAKDETIQLMRQYLT